MATMKDVREGLAILSGYGDGEEADVDAQHDVLAAAPGVARLDVSPLDRAQLETLGWHYDEEIGSWVRFT